MSSRGEGLIVGVDARSLLCREPRGEGKTLLRLYQEIARIEPDLRLVFFGDEHGHSFSGELPPRTEVALTSSRGSRFDAWENLRLPLTAISHRCDVLHCAGSGGPAWSMTPILLTVHDVIPMLMDDGQSDAETKRFKRRLSRGLARAGAVIAVSENTRRDLARTFPDSASKLEVVHWGPPDKTAQRTTDAQAKPVERYVLAFGGTAPRKNTVYTLERYAAAAARTAGLSLVLVGISSNAQRTELEAHAARLGVTGRVRMPGFVDERQLQQLLAGAEMVLYLSQYEGFGLPILEAVASGVPVVASDTSSIPEVLSDGESCHALNNPGAIENAIWRITTDREFRVERIRTQARATAHFQWRNTANRTMAMLRAVATGD